MRRLIAAVALALPMAVWAQAWPSAKPVTLIVPFTPGGNVDFAARLFATRLQQALKQSVIVENVAGAGGIVGVQKTVQSAPDGYTLLVGVDSPSPSRASSRPRRCATTACATWRPSACSMRRR